ncbi:MAG: ATP-dependent DNA helicase RecG, partial [Tissierellia bacterium]|nr:ATP-dependent DNA helicase RecG [Tissierellia bacterium]
MKLNEISVNNLKGVGKKTAELLGKLNIFTVNDLINHFPRSYEDYNDIKFIADLNPENSIYKVKVITEPRVNYIRGNLNMLKCVVEDESSIAELVFFNQPFLKNSLYVGRELLVSAKTKYSAGKIQLSGPKILTKTDRESNIEPIYSLTKGLTNKNFKKLMNNALNVYGHLIKEYLPSIIKYENNLMDIKDSYQNIHYPKNKDDLNNARYRLAFDELFLTQMALLYIKNKNSQPEKSIEFKYKTELTELVKQLPYKLTNAQNKVMREIINDMCQKKRMSRLVQGDVGSGKTIIAILSMYLANLNGYQAAMMAPTEILAKQHFESINNILAPKGIKTALLIGSMSQKLKREVYDDLKIGNIDIVIGTHALFQKSVEFRNLGLTITDEQHRFGVLQRDALYKKGEAADNLIMTATPIPRTLSMILYGDTDISVIDELPPGRKKIETYVINSKMLERADNFLEKQIESGRQAYIVCPLIEENDSELRAAEEIYKHYKKLFANYEVELLHGKMKAEEKDMITERFVNKKTDILVSTTVIEVGVNVKNANLMMIYNADRFGLSQLHQLRGRVGRGEYQSYCILISDNLSEIAYKRMRVIKSSEDGFYIAEKDLEIRGPGEMFGTRQHGIPEFKIADLSKDSKLLLRVRRISEETLNLDPDLK